MYIRLYVYVYTQMCIYIYIYVYIHRALVFAELIFAARPPLVFAAWVSARKSRARFMCVHIYIYIYI